jgi:hypothetical protein
MLIKKKKIFFFSEWLNYSEIEYVCQGPKFKFEWKDVLLNEFYNSSARSHIASQISWQNKKILTIVFKKSL